MTDDEPSENTKAFLRDHPPIGNADTDAALFALAILIEAGKVFYDEQNKYLHKLNQQKNYVIDLLADFYEPNEARQWIFAPQKLLDGTSPAELIRAGRIDEVMRLVGQLRDAVHL